MKLRVNPPIALESTEFYGRIRLHKGQTTVSGGNQTFTIKPNSLDSVLIVSIRSADSVGDGCWMLVGVAWYATQIAIGTHNNMPTITLSGDADSGIKFTWATKSSYYKYTAVEICHQW